MLDMDMDAEKAGSRLELRIGWAIVSEPEITPRV
jgi:hypothetical protein